MVKLGAVCDVRDGTHDSPKYVEKGYPLVTSKNVSGGSIDLSEVNYISKEDYDKINIRSGVDDGDIVMPMIGTIGNPVIVEKNFDFAIKNVALVKFMDNGVLNRYIFYILSSNIFKRYIEKENRGGTQKFISLSNIRNFQIPRPPLDVQKKIAQTLDVTAELIALWKKQLAELDNLIKATFYDMFGDPVINEKGWEVVRLGNKLNIISGFAFKSTEFKKQGIPVIKIGNINSGVFIDAGISFWTYDKKLEKYLLRPKDIVISLTGTVGKNDYANVCILPDKYPEYYLNQRNAKLELSDQINVRYLLYLLKDYKIKGQLTGISRGIRQANISNSDILSLNIPLPPLDLQNRFAEIVTKIEEQKDLVQKAIAESQYLFDSLMSEYFE